jgi:hypothetical protein
VIIRGGTKQGIEAELRGMGRWGAFVKLREKLKREMPVNDAWVEAAKQVRANPNLFAADVDLDAPGAERASEQDETVFLRMVAASTGKTATMAVCRDWVLENMLKPLDQVDPESVPSPAAVTILRTARLHPHTFVGDVVKKVNPKQDNDQANEELIRDDREHEQLCADFLRRREELRRSESGSAARSADAVLPPGPQGPG